MASTSTCQARESEIFSSILKFDIERFPISKEKKCNVYINVNEYLLVLTQILSNWLKKTFKTITFRMINDIEFIELTNKNNNKEDVPILVIHERTTENNYSIYKDLNTIPKIEDRFSKVIVWKLILSHKLPFIKVNPNTGFPIVVTEINDLKTDDPIFCTIPLIVTTKLETTPIGEYKLVPSSDIITSHNQISMTLISKWISEVFNDSSFNIQFHEQIESQ